MTKCVKCKATMLEEDVMVTQNGPETIPSFDEVWVRGYYYCNQPDCSNFMLLQVGE